MEDIRRCKKRGKRRLSWTSARQALAKTVALGGGDATDCAGVGSGAIRVEGFLPVEALEVIKLWQARTFAAAELAPSMTLKSYSGAKTLDPKGDAYDGS